MNILVAALERPRRLVIRELMIDCLPHRELVHIRFEKAVDYSFHIFPFKKGLTAF
jgi:hypothetical protein